MTACKKSKYLSYLSSNTIYIGKSLDQEKNPFIKPIYAQLGSIANPCKNLSDAFVVFKNHYTKEDNVSLEFVNGNYDTFLDYPFIVPNGIKYILCNNGLATLPNLSCENIDYILELSNVSIKNLDIRQSSVNIDHCFIHKLTILPFQINNEDRVNQININSTSLEHLSVDLQNQENVICSMDNVSISAFQESLEWIHVVLKNQSKFSLTISNSILRNPFRNYIVCKTYDNSSFSFDQMNLQRYERSSYYELSGSSKVTKNTENNKVEHPLAQLVCSLILKDFSNFSGYKINNLYTIHETIENTEQKAQSICYKSLHGHSKCKISFNNHRFVNRSNLLCFQTKLQDSAVNDSNYQTCEVESSGTISKNEMVDESYGKSQGNNVSFKYNGVPKDPILLYTLKNDAKTSLNNSNTNFDVTGKDLLSTSCISKIHLLDRSNLENANLSATFRSNLQTFREVEIKNKSIYKELFDGINEISLGDDSKSIYSAFHESKSNLKIVNANLQKIVHRNETKSFIGEHSLLINNAILPVLEMSGPTQINMFGSRLEHDKSIPFLFSNGIQAQISSSNVNSTNHPVLKATNALIQINTSNLNLHSHDKNVEIPNLQIEKDSSVQIKASSIINNSSGTIAHLFSELSQILISTSYLSHKNKYLCTGVDGGKVHTDPVSIPLSESNKIAPNLKLLSFLTSIIQE